MDPREMLKIGTAMSYEEIFARGGASSPIDLLNQSVEPVEWKVKILTGFFPDMGGRWLRHRKRVDWRSEIDARNKTVSVVAGYNVLRDDDRWGHFRVGVGLALDGRTCLVLKYDVSANSFLTRPIVDHVRTTSDPRLMIGKLYFGGHFGGYFTLERI